MLKQEVMTMNNIEGVRGDLGAEFLEVTSRQVFLGGVHPAGLLGLRRALQSVILL